jgi:integrase
MGVSVRQQKRDGEWYVHIRQNGTRAAQKCVNEEHAIETQKAVLTAIAAGQFDIAILKKSREAAEEKTPAQTLSDYYKQSVQPLWEGSLSRNTYKSYSGSFQVHILPALGDAALTDVTRDRVKRFVAELRKKSVATSKKNNLDESTEEQRRLSKETIRNILAALRAAMTEAVENNVIASNPATKLGKFYKEAADFREDIDPFSADEVTALLQATCEHFGFENYVLMLTLFHCGLRAGEAAGLYWSDLDMKNKTLLVRRQFTRGKKGKPKTRKKRAVDVSTVLLGELQALKRQRQAEYLEAGRNEIPDLIFLGPGQIEWEDGKPVGRGERGHVDMDNWRNRVFWKACDKAKVRRRRVHDTRHTFASLLLSNGESLKYVSSQLGHASIRMTADVYGHLEIGSNRAAMDRLPSLNTPPKTQVANA